MRRLGFGVLFGVAAYVVAAAASYFLVQRFSSNIHDREMEAGMTGLFFFGPIAGIAGFIAGVVRGGRRGSASG
ncbi:MAG: hypothetical protein ABJD07_02865 [Gemmatimonadaceae bacterium]